MLYNFTIIYVTRSSVFWSGEIWTLIQSFTSHEFIVWSFILEEYLDIGYILIYWKFRFIERLKQFWKGIRFIKEFIDNNSVCSDGSLNFIQFSDICICLPINMLHFSFYFQSSFLYQELTRSSCPQHLHQSTEKNCLKWMGQLDQYHFFFNHTFLLYDEYLLLIHIVADDCCQ